MIFTANDSTFNDEVLERSFKGVVFAYFWATWCPPCRMLSPTLQKLAGELEVNLAKVDSDESTGLVNFFQIRGIPTVIAFHNGQKVGSFSGGMPEPTVRNWMQQFLV